jgi:hypothetical protein
MFKIIIRIVLVIIAFNTLFLNLGSCCFVEFKKELSENKDLTKEGESEVENLLEEDVLIYFSTQSKTFEKYLIQPFSLGTLYFYSENGFCSPIKDILAPPPKV